jgi:dihydrofolate reductase
MSQVRVESFSISLVGCGAGPNQGVENPLGVGGEALHDWIVSSRSWRQAHGKEGGESGTDDEFAARNARNVGAWIMGRNMFGPIRGPWPDTSWKGWWGKNPPSHRFCSAVESDCSTGWTRQRSDTNASSSSDDRRPAMWYSGTGRNESLTSVRRHHLPPDQ